MKTAQQELTDAQFQYVEPLDSAGRTEKQVEDMQRNAVIPPKLPPKDKAYAAYVARTQDLYPKAMYIGVESATDPETGDILYPKGEPRTPNYHQFEEYRRGRTMQVFDRLPFKTLLVHDKEEEKAARAKGYVESPAELPDPQLA